jgi:hypothetical protein
MQREVRTLPPVPPSAEAAAVLADLEKLIVEDTTNLVRVATADGADFQVKVDNSEIRILDPADAELPYLRPPAKIADANALCVVKARLVHLARFANVQQLTNNDPTSPLANKLVLSLHAASGDQIVENALPIEPCFSSGMNFFLRIRNTSTRNIDLAVLDLAPGWSIDHVNEGVPLSVDAGKQIDLKLTAELPSGYQYGTDVLKVIGTLAQTDFGWLTLPPLDQPFEPKSSTREPQHPLEQLMQLMQEPPVAMRSARIASSPTREWTEAQIRFDVIRSVIDRNEGPDA